MGVNGRRIGKIIASFAISGIAFAASGDKNDEFNQFQNAFQAEQAASNSQSLNNEFKQFLAEAEKQAKQEALEYAAYKKEIERQWDEFKGSTKKEWVDYSNNKSSRSIVDFEKGKITLEVVIPVADKKPQKASQDPAIRLAALKKLKKQLSRILKDNSNMGESPIAKQLSLKNGKKLKPSNLNQFTKSHIENEIVVKNKPFIAKDGKPRIKAKVTVSMVPNHLKIRADKFKKPVKKYSKQYNVDPALVFAVIHTESYFNPKARSPVPAYGLMQLVPSSGGRDAYRKAFGRDKAPSASYLYKPAKNIQLGVAYLNVLFNREFKKVKNAESKTYLAIAAYNTGGGNVSRAITGNKNIYKAANKINRMSPSQIFKTLKTRLPYEETQKYVVNVSKRQKLYEGY